MLTLEWNLSIKYRLTLVCEYYAGDNVEEHPRIIIWRQVLDLEWVFGFNFSESSSAWLHLKILFLQPLSIGRAYFIGMESSTEVVEQNDSSNGVNESDLNSIRNEVSPALINGKGLEPPILGSSYRAPDIPKKYIEPIALDTSLPYIPIYTHLKTYDLKPIGRPLTPPILSELRSKCQNDADSCKSSKASLSTGTKE